MDLRKKLEFKNEVTESDKMKHNILFVSKIIEAAKNSKSFEDYTAKINEDKEGLMMYGFGAPKYTTLDYILDIEVYDFLSTLGINVEQQIHQVDENNDPVMMKLRAQKEKDKKQKEIDIARKKKRVYGKEREKLEDRLIDIQQELKELYTDKRELNIEQEEEAGHKGDDWSDADANRYGSKFNKIDDEIAKLKQEREKIENKLHH